MSESQVFQPGLVFPGEPGFHRLIRYRVQTLIFKVRLVLLNISIQVVQEQRAPSPPFKDVSIPGR